MVSKNKEILTVVVNGRPIDLDVNENAPLHTLVPKALEETGNQGQPLQNWELRDEKGTLLDLNQKIEDFHFAAGTKLFLNPKAGVGG